MKQIIQEQIDRVITLTIAEGGVQLFIAQAELNQLIINDVSSKHVVRLPEARIERAMDDAFHAWMGIKTKHMDVEEKVVLGVGLAYVHLNRAYSEQKIFLN